MPRRRWSPDVLSAQYIRENEARVRRDMARRGADVSIDAILTLDESRRSLLQQVEALRAERNATSRAISQVRDAAERDAKISAMRDLGARLDAFEGELRETESQLRERMLEVPNILDASVPDGPDETANVVIETAGELPAFNFEPRPHWELAATVRGIDFERGVKMSGSRFFVLQGPIARLHRSLVQFMLDSHSDAGFEEHYLPYMLSEESLYASGQLPKFRDNLYRDAEEDYFFIPTAEVAFVNLFRDEILAPGSLPKRLVAHTPCFRREKMSAGRDVRGIKRVHQFDKVEMFVYCEPGESQRELDFLLSRARSIPEALGLAHRVVQLCTGDIGFNSSVTFDVEVWAPGAGEWLEVSSVSNCLDFQAHRAGIRFRGAHDEPPRFPHMLNASGLGLVRTLIAVMENYQRADGSIDVPQVLQRYMGTDRIEPHG